MYSKLTFASVSCRYVTAFTYFHYVEKGDLTMQDVRAHVKLQPICGTLSYSTILNSYKYRLGMTGTLECLTKVPLWLSTATAHLDLFSFSSVVHKRLKAHVYRHN